MYCTTECRSSSGGQSQTLSYALVICPCASGGNSDPGFANNSCSFEDQKDDGSIVSLPLSCYFSGCWCTRLSVRSTAAYLGAEIRNLNVEVARFYTPDTSAPCNDDPKALFSCVQA